MITEVSKASNFLLNSLAIIRNKKTSREKFIFHSNLVNTILLQKALDTLPTFSYTITTPVDKKYYGIGIDFEMVCGVSIMRAGDAMVDSLRALVPDIRIGKILIQRDDETATPVLSYHKVSLELMQVTAGNKRQGLYSIGSDAGYWGISRYGS